jgi:hypothetical protein
MKKKILTTALALFGAAGLISAVHAAPITYQTGDIILGFEATSGVTNPAADDLLIDLGQYSNLSSFSTFNISSDLNAVFGSGNWSAGQISFGAIGVTLSGNHYADIYETGTNTLLPVASTSQTTRQDYIALATGSIGYQTLTAYSNSWSGYGVFTAASTTGSWSSYQPQKPAFGVSEDIENTIGSSLNLYDKIYVSNGSGTVASTPYTINVDTLGNITVQSVPEPSTYVMFGLGSLLLVVAYRRRVIS